VNDASTAISLEDAAGLIPNLATRQELNEFEYTNLLEARTWVLNDRRLKKLDPFAEPFIRDLHRRMLNQTWRWAGQYRTSNPNLGIPFHLIREELGRLLGDARYWVENKTYDLDEIATRFHHRIVSIHPFPDGNGRHGRLLADVVLAKWGREPFSWGPDNVAVNGATHDNYIKALRQADEGDIGELMKFARS
jgi:Fic-DOC domain mobile mystery protein B